MIRVGIAFGFGLVVLAAIFFLIYGNKIERIDTSPLYQCTRNSVAIGEGSNFELSSNATQMIVRLVLFIICVGVSFLVTFLLGRFTQFEKEPMYLTTSFFGMLGTSMVVTGLLKEQTLLAFIPWAKPTKT